MVDTNVHNYTRAKQAEANFTAAVANTNILFSFFIDSFPKKSVQFCSRHDLKRTHNINLENFVPSSTFATIIKQKISNDFFLLILCLRFEL